MKRRSFFTALFAILLPAFALAQVPVATPTPNPMVYDDPGMHFAAPAGWIPIGQRHVPVKQLGQDPMTVAGWVTRGHGHPKQLIIQQQYYTDDLDGFDGVYEQQLRTQFQGAFFKNKQHFTLSNGMPAYFVEMTAGEGFSITKAYICIWIDGTRGVSLVMAAHLGDIDADTAKAIFKTASATRYPIGRDE